MTGSTALCSAQACSTTYSILIDEHARIGSHTPISKILYNRMRTEPSEKMKVIMLSQGEEKTGINRYAINTYRAVPEISELYFLKFRTTHGKYSVGKAIEGRFRYGASIFNLNSLIPQLGFRNFIKYIKEEKNMGSIIHVMSPHVLPIVPGNDNIVTIHDVSPFIPGGDSSLDLKIIKIFYKRYLKFENIITDNRYMAEKVAELGARGTITTIYPYISDDFHPLNNKKELRKKYSLPTDKYLILSVSTDLPRKNIQILPKIMSKLGNDFVLVRVGPGVNNAIRLFPKNDQELNEIYNACDLFISTSIDEGFGFPVVEAMKAGIPVAISDIPVYREVAGKGAYYFDPFDIDNISRVVREVLMSEPQNRKNFEESLRKFSRDEFRKSILWFYTSIRF